MRIILFLALLINLLCLSTSLEEKNSTIKTNSSALMSTATRIELIQRRFNLIKKKLEKQQAKKSIRQFALKNTQNKTQTTSEYDPILKKPTSSPVTRKTKLLSLTNKILNRDLNDEVKPQQRHSTGFSFSKKSDNRNVGYQSNSRVLAEKSSLSNQCWSSPCLNGSSCFGSSTSYFCYCSSGFTGPNCETKTASKKKNS